MRINKVPAKRGYWKMMRPMGVEAQWDDTAGKYKLYTSYTKEMSGDDVGAWFTFDSTVSETIEVSMGVSFVSIENARLNLERSNRSEPPSTSCVPKRVRCGMMTFHVSQSKAELKNKRSILYSHVSYPYSSEYPSGR